MATIISVPGLTPTDVWVLENGNYAVLSAQTEVIQLIDTGKGDPGPIGPQGESMITYTMDYNLYVSSSTRFYRFPFAATLLGVSGGLTTAPVGSPVIIDINVNGTTIFPNQNDRPQFADGIDDLPEIALNVPIVPGDRVSVDVDDIGSTFEGEDLSIFIRYERTA